MSDAAPTPLKLAVLLSGGGRTLANLLAHQQEHALPIDVRLVVSSSAKAGGLQIATDASLATHVCRRNDAASDKDYGRQIFDLCRAAEVDYVVMAGFLKFVPVPEDFTARVINIHPSLVPAFCGQGMFGGRVHQAVLDYGVKLTGCTVHFVDNEYDHGPVIAQADVAVRDDDTVESLAARVFAAECELYPRVLRLLAEGRFKLVGRRVSVTSSRLPD